MFSIKTRLLVLAAGLIIPAGIATPALASSTPQTVNVSVNSVISISGLANVSFTGNPGTTANGVGYAGTCAAGQANPGFGTPTQCYTVVSNDGAGYSLSETAFAAQFSNASSYTIPDTDWQIVSMVNSSGGSIKTFNPSTTAQTVYTTTAGPSTDNYTEEWTMALPATLPAGTFTNQLTYLATGN
jgi:hypothetical protein